MTGREGYKSMPASPLTVWFMCLPCLVYSGGLECIGRTINRVMGAHLGWWNKRTRDLGCITTAGLATACVRSPTSLTLKKSSSLSRSWWWWWWWLSISLTPELKIMFSPAYLLFLTTTLTGGWRSVISKQKNILGAVAQNTDSLLEWSIHH